MVVGDHALYVVSQHFILDRLLNALSVSSQIVFMLHFVVGGLPVNGQIQLCFLFGFNIITL
jgi:hypothetical protein